MTGAIGRPPNPTRTERQLKVRLEPLVHTWLRSQAREQERSMTWLVNKLLSQAKQAQQEDHEKAA